jgi:hypothetical protein
MEEKMNKRNRAVLLAFNQASMRFNLQRFADGGDTGEHEQSKEDADQSGTDGDGDNQQKNDEKKYSDEDVNRILGAKFAKWQKEQEKKQAEADEAKKLANMSAEEKAAAEKQKEAEKVAKLEKELTNLKERAARAELSKEAAKIMKADHEIIATQDMLDFVVGQDAETTKANISKLVSIIQDDRKAQDALRAKGVTPKVFSNDGAQMTALEKAIARHKH